MPLPLRHQGPRPESFEVGNGCRRADIVKRRPESSEIFWYAGAVVARPDNGRATLHTADTKNGVSLIHRLHRRDQESCWYGGRTLPAAESNADAEFGFLAVTSCKSGVPI